MDLEIARTLSEGLRKAATRPNVLHYKPHSKQLPFHANQAKGRLYIGGNRSGKTTAGVVEDVWWAQGNHPHKKTPEPPVRGRVIGVDYPDGIEKIILPEFQRWVPFGQLKGGSWTTGWSERRRKLTWANGSFIEFMSYEQAVEAFAGTSRHFIHFDEEPPQPLFSENMMRLIDTKGLWWITMTPVQGMTWVYDSIYLNPNDNIFVIEADITENPHLSRDEIDTVLGFIDDPAELKARKEGKFVQLGGLVFKSFNYELHVRDLFIPPVAWAYYMSLDHGFNDPTAIHWHAVAPNGDVFTFAEHYMREWTVKEHCAHIREFEKSLPKRPELRIADPSIKQRTGFKGESIQIEYSKYGIDLALGNNEQIAGVNKMNTYLRQNKWYVTENCPHLIRELQRVRWETYSNKKLQADKNRREKIHDKDNHCTDGTRYFFTFMPELAPLPVADTKTEEINKLLLEAIGPVTINSGDDITDWNLVYTRPQGEWSVVDEHIGGIW